MEYWWSVARRAWKEAAKAVGLETFQRLIVFLIGQAALSFLLWVGMNHSLPDSAIWTRVLTAALPFLLFPLLFLWNFLQVPPILSRETSEQVDALKGELARISTSATSRAEREVALAELATRGRTLRDLIGRRVQESEWLAYVEEVEATVERIGVEVGTTISLSAAAAFVMPSTAQLSVWPNPCEGHRDHHNFIKSYLNELISRLGEIVRNFDFDPEKK